MIQNTPKFELLVSGSKFYQNPPICSVVFFRYVANKQTNSGKNITSFVELSIQKLITLSLLFGCVGVTNLMEHNSLMPHAIGKDPITVIMRKKAFTK